jgi:hypothetical protein
MATILSSPGLEGLWQMHWSYNGLLERNTPGLFIANVDDMPTVAGVLTAPPRGSGPGAGGRGTQAAATAAAPPTSAPATTPPATSAVPAEAQAAPVAPAAGRGRTNDTGHTPAYWLRISARADGSFTISNPRNGFSKSYGARVKVGGSF